MSNTQKKISVVLLVLIPLSFFIVIYLQNLLNLELTTIEVSPGVFEPKELSLAQMAGTALLFNLLPTFILLYFWLRILRYKLQDLGLVKPKLKQFIFWAFITSLAAITYLGLSIFFEGNVGINDRYNNIYKFLISAFVDMLPFVFLEEFIYRGLIFKAFLTRMNVFWTIILQAIIFGFTHNMTSGTFLGISIIIFVGLILGLARLYSKSIWPGTVGHLINNFVMFYIW